jgi:uncharacterized protein (DUF885 family)
MNRKILIMILAALLLLPYGCTRKENPGKPVTSEEFAELTLQWFKEDVSADPIDLHFSLTHPEKYGISELGTSLGEVDSDDDGSQLRERIRTLEEMSTDQLTEDQKLAYASMLDYYRCQLGWYELEEDYTFVFTPNSGVNNNLITSFTEFVPRNEEEVRQLIALVKDSGRYLDDCVAYTREQFDKGIVQTDGVIDSVIDSMERFISKTEDNEVIRTFNENLEALNLDGEAEYKAQMRSAVLDEMLPGYRKAISLLRELRGSGKAKGPLNNYGKAGREYYEQLFREKSSSSKSVAEWEKLLKKKINTLVSEEISLARKNYSTYMKWVNGQYNYGLDEAYEIFTALKQNLVTEYPQYPEVDYTIDYLDPSVTSDNIAAYYLIAPFDDIQSVNVVRANPNFALNDPNGYVVTLAHEGYPGHLYQTTYYYTNHPDQAIRYALNFSGYTEGWAMYAEESAMGYFTEDGVVVRLDRTDNQLNYYLEAYLDILVNYEGYSVEKLADEMDALGLNSEVAQDIYDVLVGDPAVFVPYSIGLYEMIRLRDMAQEKLGSAYDAISYNKVILDAGATSFDILEQQVSDYIKAGK